MLRIMVVEDDQIFRKNLCKALTLRGYDVYPVENGEVAVRLILEKDFDAALIDMKMPGMDGMQVIKELKEIQPSVRGIILTGYGSIEDAVETIKLGGYHYLTKPCEMKEIEDVLKKISEEMDEAHETDAGTYQGIVGASPGIKKVIRLIKKVKDLPLPVIISGESGTGKELAARALHFDSCRKAHNFIAINCATLKPELLENELFGHVKGAFTGALGFKEGLVKLADSGTFFIDEIGDMNQVVQASLLRFIETGIFRLLGSSKEVRVNTRIVAAINKDIEDEVRAKRFRQDLYYRLNVCRINIPPLRERAQDIAILARHFLSKFTTASGKSVTLSSGAVELLMLHSWPGNVRELSHVLQRAIVLLNRGDDTLTKRHIEESLHSRNRGMAAEKPYSVGPLKASEKEYVAASLMTYDWNVSRTAAALGIDRRTLQRKITRYQILR